MIPFSAGGAATAENLQVLCATLQPTQGRLVVEDVTLSPAGRSVGMSTNEGGGMRTTVRVTDRTVRAALRLTALATAARRAARRPGGRARGQQARQAVGAAGVRVVRLAAELRAPQRAPHRRRHRRADARRRRRGAGPVGAAAPSPRLGRRPRHRAAPPPASSKRPRTPPRSSPSFSSTNVQEAGDRRARHRQDRRPARVRDHRRPAATRSTSPAARRGCVGSLDLAGSGGHQLLLRGDRVLVMTTSYGDGAGKFARRHRLRRARRRC